MANISKLLPASGFVIAAVLVVATSAFKQAPKTKGGDATYYFEYNPTLGAASAPGSWQFTSDGTGCSGDGQSCKILLPEDYVNTTTSPVSIDASALPGPMHLLPTVSGSGTNLVPDPSATDIYLEIDNKNP